MDEDQVFKAVQKVEEIVRREINYHIANKTEFLNKIKSNYFYKEIVESFTLLIGDDDEFRRLIK